MRRFLGPNGFRVPLGWMIYSRPEIESCSGRGYCRHDSALGLVKRSPNNYNCYSVRFRWIQTTV